MLILDNISPVFKLLLFYKRLALRVYLSRFLFLAILLLCTASSFFAQNGVASYSNLEEVELKADLLGHGFDLRKVDPKSWVTSSKGKAVVTGASLQSTVKATASMKFHFITTPYEYERDFLQTDTEERLFQAYSSEAYFKPWESTKTYERLFAYTELERALYTRSLPSNTIQLDSAIVADFSRLGRDITPEGFVHRYGTHYAQEVTYGGRFLKRYNINKEDIIYSPYDKNTFKEKLKEDIIASQNNLPDTDPYINSGKPSNFTIGGNIDAINPKEWEATVTNQSRPIDVVLMPYTQLFARISLPELDDKQEKIDLLDTFYKDINSSIKKQLKVKTASQFYKKYSLRFEQTLHTVVKKASGSDDENETVYTGDLFFGGFSKDDALLKSRPFIDLGDISLETLITDEKLQLDRNVLITIKPEDIERGYVSVWDDTKKLFKSKERKTLRVSGPEANKTRYFEALTQNIQKTVEIKTVEKDIYEVAYSLKLIKEESILKNLSTTYNYVLDTQLIAAVTNGDKKRLDSLFKKNGNPKANGLIAPLILNKHSNELLNYVLNQGALPTTSDLDLLFERDYFDEEKALILLERGAQPKNNMLFKAVAYKSANTIYALLREGATPQNNDLSFAIEKYYYPTIKALMSQDFKEFEAGKKELYLAAENNDPELAQKFIKLGATADALILDKAIQFDNLELKNTIVPVTEANGETLEVVANLDDTVLFAYFVEKNAKLESNTAVEVATDNDNIEILDLALKNGGEPTQALAYAIKKENKPAIQVSLKNKAQPDAVFEYAADTEDLALFNEALKEYGGTPDVALEAAVQRNVIPMAQSVLNHKSKDINLTQSLDIAVSNESLEMVKLLVSNDADPNKGISQAVNQESVPITDYLIRQGAQTTDPSYLQSAVTNENLELSKLLIEKGSSQADNAIVEASTTGNVEITKYLLDKGATAQEAFKSAMETKNEDVILLLMEEINSFNQSHIITAARKGNIQVVQKLLEEGLNSTPALANAINYKKLDVIHLLLDNGAIASPEMLQTALNYNFFKGVKALIEKSALTGNTQFSNGEYPAHIVASSYEADEDPLLLALLIEKGARINAQNFNGETPLHLAAVVTKDDIGLIELLLNNGASVQIPSHKGATPLSYARDKSIKALLKKEGKRVKKTKGFH